MDPKILCERNTEGWALSLDRKGENVYVFRNFLGGKLWTQKYYVKKTTEGWPLSQDRKGETFYVFRNFWVEIMDPKIICERTTGHSH